MAAVIEYTPNGNLVVLDLGADQTFVEGERVSKAVLIATDEVVVAGETITVVDVIEHGVEDQAEPRPEPISEDSTPKYDNFERSAERQKALKQAIELTTGVRIGTRIFLGLLSVIAIILAFIFGSAKAVIAAILLSALVVWVGGNFMGNQIAKRLNEKLIQAFPELEETLR